MKKQVAMLLALGMAASALSGCGGGSGAATTTAAAGSTAVETNNGTYTYKDFVVQMATNWSPHTYQTSDDAYPAEYIRVGLYGFIFNDDLHPVEGKENYEGYVIIPEMAAGMPVDVTEKIKAEHPEYGIPESATAGYAYTIDLNQNAVWEDGTKIDADTYVYSMQQLLDPKLLNYRATDTYTQAFSIAGAEAYANSGRTIYKANGLDIENVTYQLSDLKKQDDGTYVTPDGAPVYIGLEASYPWLNGYTMNDYSSYVQEDVWAALQAMVVEDGYIPVTDEALDKFAEFTGSDNWGNEERDKLANYLSYQYTYPEVAYDGTVGLYKSGDYQITLVLAKSLAGFNLLYNLTSNWIVYKDLYESCLTQNGDVWSSTYNTSVETTKSYGPYKLTEYQTDKFMRYERNDTWYGYTDGQHQYVDPTDGKTYDMYMTDIVTTEVVAEPATQKLMFLKGQLMTYGLQTEDFATYRNSEYVHVTPSETIYFLIFNGYMEALQNREANAGFDQSKYDLETMSVKEFRQAIALSFDKELFCTTVSPARSGGYGLIGNSYIYDPDTGARYRDTDQAKNALCEFYSVDPSKFSSLDEAVASITGYDPAAAKEYFKKAFDKALEAGYITDNDNDGICDQTISMEYAVSQDSDFLTKIIDYLNEKIADVIAGTPFEGKIVFTKSAAYGNDWADKIMSGMADFVLAGWSGSALDPFGLTDLYANPDRAYDGKWFNANGINKTMTIGGEEITMSLKNWSDALNGTTVTVGGKEYNFGEGIADIEDRLTILAGMEAEILQSYDYIPMMQNASMTLLTQQAYYVVDEYNPVMGRGGIAYLKYNYDDAAWTEYVAAQGGELKY